MLISLKQTAVPHTFLTSLRPPPAVNFPWVVSLYTVIEERKRSCRVVCLSGFHLLSSPCWKNHIWEKIRVVFSWDFVSWSRVAHPIVASLLFFFFFPQLFLSWAQRKTPWRGLQICFFLPLLALCSSELRNEKTMMIACFSRGPHCAFVIALERSLLVPLSKHFLLALQWMRGVIC